MKAALRTLVGLLVLFLVVGWALTSQGQINNECDFHTNHSGFLPSQYDYGVFEEDDPSVHIVSETSEDPEDYGAGSTWDRVWKCNYPETTTTTVEVTTTTSTPTSTTTVPETTTTVAETTTTAQETTTTSEATTSTTEAPTTTVPEVTTTTVVVTTTTVPEELPYTGTNVWLFPLGLVLAASGGFLVRKYRESA